MFVRLRVSLCLVYKTNHYDVCVRVCQQAVGAGEDASEYELEPMAAGSRLREGDLVGVLRTSGTITVGRVAQVLTPGSLFRVELSPAPAKTTLSVSGGAGGMTASKICPIEDLRCIKGVTPVFPPGGGASVVPTAVIPSPAPTSAGDKAAIATATREPQAPLVHDKAATATGVGQTSAFSAEATLTEATEPGVWTAAAGTAAAGDG